MRIPALSLNLTGSRDEGWRTAIRILVSREDPTKRHPASDSEATATNARRAKTLLPPIPKLPEDQVAKQIEPLPFGAHDC